MPSSRSMSIIILIIAILLTPLLSCAIPQVNDDTGTVNIHSHSSVPASAPVPIIAMIFSGDSGPKQCRGHVMASVSLPRPAEQHTAGICYDMPQVAHCGVFIADKADACEARLYSESGCTEEHEYLYVTTVAFTPDDTALGSMWKSMLVRCGVEIDEAGLAEQQAKLQAAFGEHIQENTG